MVNITYSNIDNNFKFDQEKRFNELIQQVIEDFDLPKQDLNYIFCSDDYLYKMNVDFLEHDTYTDVITFESAHELLPSEIYISIERITENADKFSVPFNTELSRVMIHGLLHLCGLNDASDDDKKVMRANENKYLKLLRVLGA
ncbi:MAG: rRNA maturation RNase YbeY [Bacteroidota bacterium]|nr:rRNA maturation RNase YbeY [Bacteroidota bacterium]